MTELKTLKDLYEELPTDGVDYNVLQKEAIKWLKLCNKDLKRTNNNDREAIMFLNGEIFAFEHFFNLTKEDLK